MAQPTFKGTIFARFAVGFAILALAGLVAVMGLLVIGIMAD